MRASMEFHVAGRNHREIVEKAENLIATYLGKEDDVASAMSRVDAEISVTDSEDNMYKATVHVRMR